MNYGKIQRSLLEDLKRILAESCGMRLPRKVFDDLYKITVGKPLAATQIYKDLAISLCSCTTPAVVFGEHRIPVGFDARAVGAWRQALGFFSRLHACVTQDVRQNQLAEAKQRVAAEPFIYLGRPARSDAADFIEYVIGSKPPPVDTWTVHHGPGAVGDGSMREKHIFRTVSKSIADYVDRQAFWYTTQHTGPDGITTSKIIAPDFDRLFRLPHQPSPNLVRRSELATKVVTVPKDATKVRIISEEPASSQFLQEGLKDVLYKRMSRFKQLDPTDQTRNQELARLASARVLGVSTLDMSNASDMVRWLHVKSVFPYDWIQAFSALRTPFMSFGDTKVKISTFAPMGSALCFPVEMLVFASLIYVSYKAAGLCGRVQEFLELDDWGVFGDDCILHNDAVRYMLAFLKGTGITCNVTKSCIGDVLFKESCGADWYMGQDVSIVRPRILESSRVNAAPMVLHANRLFAHGFVATAQELAKTVTAAVSLGYGPHLANPGLKWPRLGRVRYNQALQRFEGQVPYNRLPKPQPSQGWEALYLWFTDQRQSSSPFFRTERSTPTQIWAPMDPTFALVQNAELRKSDRIIISSGPKPFAGGTPSGSDIQARSGASLCDAVPAADPEVCLRILRLYHNLALGNMGNDRRSLK